MGSPTPSSDVPRPLARANYLGLVGGLALVALVAGVLRAPITRAFAAEATLPLINVSSRPTTPLAPAVDKLAAASVTTLSWAAWEPHILRPQHLLLPFSSDPAATAGPLLRAPDWATATSYAIMDVFSCAEPFPGEGVCLIGVFPDDTAALLADLRISVPALNISDAPATASIYKTRGYPFMVWLLCNLRGATGAPGDSRGVQVSVSLRGQRKDFRIMPRQAPGSPNAACADSNASCVGVCTVFRPSATEGVAWLQHWFALGAAHVYLYLNVERLDELTDWERARVAALLAWEPGRVTVTHWPYPYFIAGAGPRQGMAARIWDAQGRKVPRDHGAQNHNLGKTVAIGHCIATAGLPRHSHLFLGDFDEYADLSAYGWSLAALIAAEGPGVGEISMRMAPARLTAPRAPPDLGVVSSLDFFSRHPAAVADRPFGDVGARTKMVIRTDAPWCMQPHAHACGDDYRSPRGPQDPRSRFRAAALARGVPGPTRASSPRNLSFLHVTNLEAHISMEGGDDPYARQAGVRWVPAPAFDAHVRQVVATLTAAGRSLDIPLPPRG